MFIKLTNATKEHQDKPLILNSRYIVSVFPVATEDDEQVTVVYGALQSSWNVKESVEEIWDLISAEEEGDK